jgi:CRP-like cAMP-binding protein
MTTREYFQTVLDAHISDEMDEASRQLIQKLDEKNAKRKTTETKEKREASARRGLVLGFFQTHPDEAVTRDAIAEAVGISPAQVSAACKVLLAEDSITKGEAKIDKARKVVYQYKA